MDSKKCWNKPLFQPILAARSVGGTSSIDRPIVVVFFFVTVMELPFAVVPESSPNGTAGDSSNNHEEVIDFAYISVEDDNEVDIWFEGSSIASDRLPEEERQETQKTDILSFLLQEQTNPSHTQFVHLTEQAHSARNKAVEAKKRGALKEALDHHAESAHCFHQASSVVDDSGLAKSLLLLSQTQAQAAKALKRVIQLPPLRRVSLYRKQEADLSASTFLGTAKKLIKSTTPQATTTPSNAIDEMMELEQELRRMDMKLDLNNSIASLDARNRMKNSMAESFMLVGAGGGMSSSIMSNAPVHRKRANRVAPPRSPPDTAKGTNLESSWWGSASQILAPQQQAPNTKQLMRLMESLRTMGNENAALIRRAEQAEAARAEAAAARHEMRKFREEFDEKYVRLQNELNQFRRDHPTAEPVLSSQYLRPASSSATEQIQRQEQLIRKLTADLEKEKRENKEKDAVLQKYEVFYKQVKARSAQKKKEQQQKAATLSA